MLRGQSDTLFELNVLRYEHPEAKNDNWRMNLLRVSVFARFADVNNHFYRNQTSHKAELKAA